LLCSPVFMAAVIRSNGKIGLNNQKVTNETPD
jgi:hypothetical protein